MDGVLAYVDVLAHFVHVFQTTSSQFWRIVLEERCVPMVSMCSWMNGTVLPPYVMILLKKLLYIHKNRTSVTLCVQISFRGF